MVRDDATEDSAVVASARLEPLEGAVGGGSVTVRGDSAGRILDVSVESADGNPAHSGDSVLRGRLRG